MTFTPITLGSGLAGYNYVARTREQQQALFDQTPLVAREVAQVAEKLEDVETSDQLMADRNLLKVALGAFGLDEDLDNRAFIQRILDSDLDDDQSLANRLADKRYLALAEAFNFQSSDGPRLPNDRSVSELTQQLEALETADDLLSDNRLLRAALEEFGLQDNISNTYYLELVLTSDLSDPASFANGTNDPRLIEFAQVFDFYQKDVTRQASVSSLDAITTLFGQSDDAPQSTDELLADTESLDAALNVFGLDDIYTDDFLRDVLNSDLSDENSIANTVTDERLTAFSAAFNFGTPQRDEVDAIVLDALGEPVMEQGTLAAFLEAAAGSSGVYASAEAFFQERELRDAAFELLGIPVAFTSRNLAERVLDSDPTDPNSFANGFTDARYAALADLITISTPQTERSYPDGFVDQVIRNYLDRQFEIQLGEVDPDMRVALGLERELTQVVGGASTNDARWFSVMSSPPLRQVFEGAFRLPSSFGSIDIDQQLLVLKDRAERFFGTQDVTDFLQPETLDALRNDYLVSRSTAQVAASSGANVASIILSNLR